jgi:hypothetical protein
MPEEAYKRCKRCHTTKPLEEFSHTPRTRDGRFSACKACEGDRAKLRRSTPEGRALQAAYSRAYRQRHPDRVAETDKAYRQANREIKRAVDKAYRERHPTKIAERKRRQRDAELPRKQERERAWRLDHPDRVRKYADDHRRRYPQKEAARKMVTFAIKGGYLIKPEECEDCGSPTPSLDLHGHHEDYSKPLDVEWLCRGCHGKRHRK